MSERTPLARPSAEQLTQLTQILEVDFVRLTECVVNPGFGLRFGGSDLAGVHYSLAGSGRIVVEGDAAIPLAPHTLVIVPAGRPFRFETGAPGSARMLQPTRPAGEDHGAFHRFEAGSAAADAVTPMTLICGNFTARHGGEEDLFDGLATPVVEQFAPEDRVDRQMQEAFRELLAQEDGDGTMASMLLKQVLVKLLRRSIASNGLWVERLSALQDPRIAKAFAQMVARPGASHTSDSLAEAAGMSRSVFMDRFAKLFRHSPIAVLRRLRLDQAKAALALDGSSVERAARDVGYTNRSSFTRAFKEVFGEDPGAYQERTQAERRQGAARRDGKA